MMKQFKETCPCCKKLMHFDLPDDLASVVCEHCGAEVALNCDSSPDEDGVETFYAVPTGQFKVHIQRKGSD